MSKLCWSEKMSADSQKEEAPTVCTSSDDNKLCTIFSDAKAKIEDVYGSLKSEVEKLETEKSQFITMSTLLREVHFPDVITLDIGGTIFKTTRNTLAKDPDSMLAAMFSGRFEVKPDDKGAYFIDRDGTHFRHILNFLRCGELLVSKEVLPTIEKELRAEAEFYGIQSLVNILDFDKTYLKESLIVRSKRLTEYLREWIPSFESWELAYRASDHGWEAKNFHQELDHHNNSLVIMKSVCGYIFGGFNSTIWNPPEPDSDEEDDIDELANARSYGEGNFLFSFKNALGIRPMQFIPTNAKDGAIHCSYDSGPSFTSPSGIHDLFICSDANTQELSTCALGNGYSAPDGLNIDIATFLTGKSPFLLEELEVFLPVDND